MNGAQLYANDFVGAISWAKIYRWMKEEWGILPHDVDRFYSVVRIFSMMRPDGKVSREAFAELIKERAKRKGTT